VPSPSVSIQLATTATWRPSSKVRYSRYRPKHTRITQRTMHVTHLGIITLSLNHTRFRRHGRDLGQIVRSSSVHPGGGYILPARVSGERLPIAGSTR